MCAIPKFTYRNYNKINVQKNQTGIEVKTPLLQKFDVIIVGAGSFGMSTGYQLAKRGVSVLLIDAHDPPHSYGSHHGTTRIVRGAYTMGESYVKLALRSIELWKKLEREAAEVPGTLGQDYATLYDPIGVISIGPRGSRFIRSKTESCIAFGIPYEALNAQQIQERWPGFSVPSHMEGLYEPEGGILYSEQIIASYRALAVHYGAKLLPNTKVLQLVSEAGEPLVVTERGSFTAGSVLVSAGAWSARVLPELHNIIKPYRKPIAWFKAPKERYGRGRLPAFIFNNGGAEEYFGFPALDESGLKIGRHDGGYPALPGQPVPPFGAYEEDEAELRHALNLFLPEAGELLAGQTCLYENAPGEEFIIDELPGRSRVWFAGGGSGHGFKFASGIGEALSVAMLKGKEHYPLDWDAFTLKGVNL